MGNIFIRSTALVTFLLLVHVNTSAAFGILSIHPAGWSTLPFFSFSQPLVLITSSSFSFYFEKQTTPFAPTISFVKVAMTAFGGFSLSLFCLFSPLDYKLREDRNCLSCSPLCSQHLTHAKQGGGRSEEMSCIQIPQCSGGSSKLSQTIPTAYLNYTILAGRCVHACNLGIQDAGAEGS